MIGVHATRFAPLFASQDDHREKIRRTYAKEGAIVGGLGCAAILVYYFQRDGIPAGDLRGSQRALVGITVVASVGALGALTGALFGSMFPKTPRASADTTANLQQN